MNYYMSSEKTFHIDIPTDFEGYVVLQCSLCNSFFKVKAEELKDESQLNIWCPQCGLIPDKLLTDEVVELAQRMVNNYAVNMLRDFDKNISKLLKNSIFDYKSNDNLRSDQIDSLIVKIDELEIEHYGCCRKDAKINSNLKMIGGYCPFCGDMRDGD